MQQILLQPTLAVPPPPPPPAPLVEIRIRISRSDVNKNLPQKERRALARHFGVPYRKVAKADLIKTLCGVWPTTSSEILLHVPAPSRYLFAP